MNNENIALIEKDNGYSTIHLHYSESDHLWIAYGHSAFSLRLFLNKNNIVNKRGLSSSLQLPYTQIDEKTLKILTDTIPANKVDEKHYVFNIGIEFDPNDYKRWVYRLNEEHLADGGFNITTHVSHLVPKEGFIKDGMSTFARISKRWFDCFASFCALVIFSPLFLICHIMVKREDGGPSIYKQERIGRHGKPFYIYKFRTMRLDAEKMGPQLSHGSGVNDPRLTKIGLFLRAHHLDELPQLWNVFKGDMAFVGPRPERKFYIDQIIEHDPRYEYLYQIRPGVTSYATFYNGYTDTMEKMLRRLEYDLYYLQGRSWMFDIKILAKTFFGIIFGKKF